MGCRMTGIFPAWRDRRAVSLREYSRTFWPPESFTMGVRWLWPDRPNLPSIARIPSGLSPACDVAPVTQSAGQSAGRSVSQSSRSRSVPSPLPAYCAICGPSRQAALYILSPLTRLVPPAGIFSLPSRDYRDCDCNATVMRLFHSDVHEVLAVPPDAELVRAAALPAGGDQVPAQQVQQSGLARAVGAHDGDARAHVDAYVHLPVQAQWHS
eukprot:6367808-Pyramimonas_sp.AAC.1